MRSVLAVLLLSSLAAPGWAAGRYCWKEQTMPRPSGYQAAAAYNLARKTYGDGDKPTMAEFLAAYQRGRGVIYPVPDWLSGKCL